MCILVYVYACIVLVHTHTPEDVFYHTSATRSTQHQNVTLLSSTRALLRQDHKRNVGATHFLAIHDLYVAYEEASLSSLATRALCPAVEPVSETNHTVQREAVLSGKAAPTCRPPVCQTTDSRGRRPMAPRSQAWSPANDPVLLLHHSDRGRRVFRLSLTWRCAKPLVLGIGAE